MARRTDKRWTREVLEYHPVHGSRARGHPKTRWEDELDKFVWDSFCMPKGSWKELAQDRDFWRNLTTDYINYTIDY